MWWAGGSQLATPGSSVTCANVQWVCPQGLRVRGGGSPCAARRRCVQSRPGRRMRVLRPGGGGGEDCRLHVAGRGYSMIDDDDDLIYDQRNGTGQADVGKTAQAPQARSPYTCSPQPEARGQELGVWTQHCTPGAPASAPVLGMHCPSAPDRLAVRCLATQPRTADGDGYCTGGWGNGPAERLRVYI